MASSRWATRSCSSRASEPHEVAHATSQKNAPGDPGARFRGDITSPGASFEPHIASEEALPRHFALHQPLRSRQGHFVGRCNACNGEQDHRAARCNRCSGRQGHRGGRFNGCERRQGHLGGRCKRCCKRCGGFGRPSFPLQALLQPLQRLWGWDCDSASVVAFFRLVRAAVAQSLRPE